MSSVPGEIVDVDVLEGQIAVWLDPKDEWIDLRRDEGRSLRAGRHASAPPAPAVEEPPAAN